MTSEAQSCFRWAIRQWLAVSHVQHVHWRLPFLPMCWKRCMYAIYYVKDFGNAMLQQNHILWWQWLSVQMPLTQTFGGGKSFIFASVPWASLASSMRLWVQPLGYEPCNCRERGCCILSWKNKEVWAWAGRLVTAVISIMSNDQSYVKSHIGKTIH